MKEPYKTLHEEAVKIVTTPPRTDYPTNGELAEAYGELVAIAVISAAERMGLGSDAVEELMDRFGIE
jgi:ribosomal protein S18 acetylase RimI-like enzyme